MTETASPVPTPAQVALLDHIAVHGSYSAFQRRTAAVLLRNGWIEQRPATAEDIARNWYFDIHPPYYLTTEGSDVRENAHGGDV